MTTTAINPLTVAAIEKHISADSIATPVTKLCDGLRAQGNYGAENIVMATMHSHLGGYIAALRDLAIISASGYVELHDAIDWEYATALNDAKRVKDAAKIEAIITDCYKSADAGL